MVAFLERFLIFSKRIPSQCTVFSVVFIIIIIIILKLFFPRASFQTASPIFLSVSLSITHLRLTDVKFI